MGSAFLWLLPFNPPSQYQPTRFLKQINEFFNKDERLISFVKLTSKVLYCNNMQRLSGFFHACFYSSFFLAKIPAHIRRVMFSAMITFSGWNDSLNGG